MNRGEVWWASLNPPRGSEPGFDRPVVIISSNEFNKSLINTVLVGVITSNMRLADAPGNFKLVRKYSGLDKDSVVNISQILTLDKSFLFEKAGKLSTSDISKLNDGLKLMLTL
jgi:mRNA interferase MazF